ncbi:MAG: EAL domain-containing protein [Sulfurimonadaceae bacterium]|nr:EAL domain-containing protein [Sulfurimonadaceae bacterium]
MKPMSIKEISIYGFLTLIAGSIISAAVSLYFLFHLDTIKSEQQVTEDAYDSLVELKYYTERLLTTYDLIAEKKLWINAEIKFEDNLRDLKRFRGEQSDEFNKLWAVIQSEMTHIKVQLNDPLFQAKNTMDKSLLRRLGEGWNTNEQSDYYIALSKLYNNIEYLKQYQGFFLDELRMLRAHHIQEVEDNLQTTKRYATVLAIAILVLTALLAYIISRLIGKNEAALIESQENLRVSLDEFEHLFNTTMESIFLVEEGRCIAANEKSVEMFGFDSTEEVVGKDVMTLIATDSHAHVSSMMQLDESKPYEANALRNDGSRFPVLCRGHNIISKGKTVRIAAMLDLSDLKEKDRALRHMVDELQEKQKELIRQQSILDHMAHHDALTDLPNRVLFTDRLYQAIKKSRRKDSRTAVFFIDLDRFKQINDSLGHKVGDQVLEVVAKRLRSGIRDEDTIARLGGDEFTLLIEDITSMQTMSAMADKIIEILQLPMYVDGHELYVTSSIGISVYPDDGDEAGALLSNADAAMYKAKAEGRNNYQFYTSDMTVQAYERIIMERNMRRALDEEAFTLYYQPQVDGQSGKTRSVEALIRWPQDDGSVVSPAKFIPLAEDTGLIVPIGEWVLKTACEQIVKWKNEGYAIERIAVNLAGKQLQKEGLYDSVMKIMRLTECRPEWIELEVTEGFIMKDPEYSIGALKRLKDTGIEIAIDDFGTGYSSMTYLKQLPINTLKIDQSFVRELPENHEDAAIAKTIIALARGLKLKTIAEGVETLAQKDFLLDEGCPNIQGYFYSQPLPPVEVEKKLSRTGSLDSDDGDGIVTVMGNGDRGIGNAEAGNDRV